MLAALCETTLLPYVLNQLIMEYYPMFLYMAFHERVRNDAHCPECRTFFVSFHSTIKEAIDVFDFKQNEQEGEEGEEEENIRNRYLLSQGESVWIDEWIRRRNGDLYQVISLNSEKYNLNELSEDLQILDRKWQPLYFVLQVSFDSSKWCPENISYALTFYETLEQAHASIPLDEKDKIQDYYWKYSKKTNYEKGKFFQVITMEPGKIYNLNKHCDYVKKDTWKTLFRESPFSCKT